LISADSGGEVRVWPVAPPASRLLRGHHSNSVNVFAVSPSEVRSLSDDGTARVWNLRTGATHVAALPLPQRGEVSWTADGVAATSSPDGQIFTTDPMSGATHVMRGLAAVAHETLWLPDRRRLLTVSDDRSVRVWDVATGQSRLLGEHHTPAWFAAL